MVHQKYEVTLELGSVNGRPLPKRRKIDNASRLISVLTQKGQEVCRYSSTDGIENRVFHYNGSTVITSQYFNADLEIRIYSDRIGNIDSVKGNILDMGTFREKGLCTITRPY